MSYDPLGIEGEERSEYDPLGLYAKEVVAAEEPSPEPYESEGPKQLADLALLPITMPVSWAASSLSGIIAKSLTDDEEFANQIREDVARRTSWEPRSKAGKYVMEAVEPGFRDLSKTLRQMTGAVRMLPGVNVNPDEPLFSGKLYEHSPIEDIAQFGAEAWAFKKAGQAAKTIRGEIPSKPVVERIPERPVERGYGKTIEPKETMRVVEEYDPLGIEKEPARMIPEESIKMDEPVIEKPVVETLPEAKMTTPVEEIVQPAATSGGKQPGNINLAERYPSVPDEFFSNIDSATLSPKSMPRQQGRNISARDDKTLLHEAGHMREDLLAPTPELEAQWKTIHEKEMNKGPWGDRPGNKGGSADWMWEDLLEIFGIYHKKASGYTLTAKEIAALERNPGAVNYVQENLSKPPSPLPTGKAELSKKMETAPIEGAETGIKNAVTLAEREMKGMSEVEVETRRTFGQAFDEGKRLVESGERDPRILAKEMVDNPRPLGPEETTMLIYDRMRLQNEHRGTMDSIEKAMNEGNHIAETEARVKLLRVEEDMNTNDVAARRTGYEQGLGLAARRMMIKEDYSLSNILQRARIENDGKPISPEARAKYETISKKIAEASDKVKAYEDAAAQRESAKAVEIIKNEIAKEQRKTKRTFAKEELSAEFHGLVKELNSVLGGQFNVGIDPTAVIILGKMAKNRVRSGVITVEGLVDEIYTTVKNAGLNIDKRTIRDAISGYGKTSQMSQEAINVQMRELKRQMRLISAYEDASAGQIPLRSGLQRDVPSDTVRELGRKVKQVMRENGIDSTKARSPEEQWKTSLDAVKTRLNNRIADVTKQIEEGTRTPKRKPIEYDAEAKALREEANLLNSMLETLVEPQVLAIEKPGELPVAKTKQVNPEQKIQMALRAAEKASGEYAQMVAEGRLSKEKPTPALEVPELVEARNRRDAWRDLVKEMRDAATPKKTPEEIALKSFKTRTTNRIADLERKLSEGDFTKKPKKTLELDKEGLELKFQLDKAVKGYHEARFKDQLARRTTMQKIGGGFAEGANLIRATKTSFDLSAVLRQGGFIGLGHPIRAAKAIGPMFRALKSEKGQFAVEQEILHRPNYRLYEQSKLYLAEHGQKLAQMEEVYMSRLADKIPGVAHSQRAYTTFLNRFRADSFDAMVNKLSAKEKPTPTELNAIANYINVSTGRGNFGMKENALVGLNTVFFAPRYVASRFQLLAGQPLYRGTARTRTMIAGEYARFLAGVGTVYALGTAMGAEVEIDPRSSDVGKMKFGNVRVDPIAGLAQTATIIGRVVLGATKSIKTGELRPIRENYVFGIENPKVPYGGANTADVVARFLRTKLSPVVGTALDIATGKDVVGQKVTAETLPEKLLMPLALNDIYESMKEQGVPAGTALGILSIFGMGLQTYDPDKKYQDTMFDTFRQDILGEPPPLPERGVRAARRRSRTR